MAGILKPNIANLGREGTLTVLSSNVAGSAAGLTDGVRTNSWNTADVCYWGSGSYVEFTTTETLNIWRSGTTGYSSYTANFIIQKYNGSTYVDVSSSHTQVVTAITETQWEKTITKLAPGQYKFATVGGGLRIDSEWYLEVVPKFLVKKDNQYYSVKSSYYNATTHNYTSLGSADFTNAGFTLDDLTTQITKDSDTFVPLDKFDNFSLVMEDAFSSPRVIGLKSLKELVVATDDISTSIVDHIDYFSLASALSGSGVLKLALSIDKGVTWKTWNGSAFTDLGVTIPTTLYSSMITEEKAQWNAARDSILANGITPTIFNALDFNLLGASTIRFAYALELQAYSDAASTSQLDWKFDAKGTMVKMTDTELKVETISDKIKLTPTIVTPIMKTNIMA